MKKSAVPQKIRGINSLFYSRRRKSQDDFDKCLYKGFNEFVRHIVRYCGETHSCHGIISDYDRKLLYLDTTISLRFWENNESEPFITKSIEFAYDRFIVDHLSRVKPYEIQLDEAVVTEAKHRALNSTLVLLKNSRIIREFEFEPYPVLA